jgi:hypothetical protein
MEPSVWKGYLPIYLLASVLVAYFLARRYGRDTYGFWGAFALAVLFGPVVGWMVLALSARGRR